MHLSMWALKRCIGLKWGDAPFFTRFYNLICFLERFMIGRQSDKSTLQGPLSVHWM